MKTRLLTPLLCLSASAIAGTINPPLATPCYINGDPTASGSTGANMAAIVSLPNQSTGQSPVETVLARGNQVGATWGLAYAPTSKRLYATSVLKRHSGFGPSGTGAIYQIDVTTMTAPVVSTFLTRGDAGANPHGTLPASSTGASVDAGSFPQVGKVSFGDIDISPDEKTLYTVNLNTRELLAIDIATKAVTAYPISWAGGTNSIGTIVKAVNVGGGALPSRNGGPAFIAETSASTSILTNTGTVNQWTKVNDDIYDTAYQGANVAVGLTAMSFADAVPNGNYEVTLYFIETGAMAVGGRKADIKLEGAVAQSDFDIVAVAGRSDVPVERKFNVTVSDGTLNLELVRKTTNRPLLSGYVIRSLDTAPAAASQDVRPWAVKTQGNEVYVGVVSSGETSGLALDVKGAVLKLNKTTSTFTEHFPVDLNYITGNQWYLNDARGWYPWVADWAQIPSGHIYTGSTPDLVQHPQPILQDIEILPDGTFVLGVGDRFGFQSGSAQPNPSGTGSFSGQAGGDTLRFCLVSGNYVQEGKPGCTAGMTAFDGTERYNSTTAAGTSNVPTGTEYFHDTFVLSGTGSIHAETSWAGMTTVLGTGGVLELAVVGLDPYDTVSGGIRWYQPTSSGAVTRKTQIYRSATSNGTFGKATGLGDLEALINPEPVSVGNLVFKDLDNDGKFEPGSGESGIDGVRVQVCSTGTNGVIGGGDDVEINVGPDGIRGTADDAAGGMLTSGGGCYHFANLLPGKYFIKIPASQFNPVSASAPLRGLASSTGAQSDDGLDDTTGENGIDPVIVNGLEISGIASGVIDLANDSEVTAEPGACNILDDADDNNGDLSVDFGFWQPVCVGNLVFVDSNSDGLLTAENGLGGALMELRNPDNTPAVDFVGNPVAPITTGGSGQYLFCFLKPGDYKVRVTPPARYRPTTPAATPDADANPADNDSNGVPVIGQPYVESPVVTLVPGTEPVNDDDEFDYTNTTVDFGFVPTVGVGNLVFLDNNGNSAYDAGDTLAGGVTVQLFNQGDNPLTATPVATTTTGTTGPGTGCYLFDGLLPGNYFAFIPPAMFQSGGPLAGYLSTPGVDFGLGDDDVAENSIDSATPATTGINSIPFTLNNNSEPIAETGACNNLDDADDNNIRLTIDFGFVKPVCLGNFVFTEVNNNGLQDDATALSGATVEVFHLVGGSLQAAVSASTGTTVPTQTTGSTGKYEFCDLAPGNYVVRVTPPAGLVPSPYGGDPDDDDNADSNGQTVNGQTFVQSEPVTLAADTEPTGDELPGSGDDDNSNNTVDFGFVPGAIATPVALGDYVWCDANANGQQDAGENGVPGVTVTLTVGANVVTHVTDASGFYFFSSATNAPFLAANVGQQAVISVDRTSPALSGCRIPAPPNSGNDATDSDGVPGGTTSNVEITTVVPPLNTTDSTNDFGFTPAVCLGNLVFIDSNRDGLSTGEEGLAGATVSLFQSNGTSSVTDINGVTVAPIVTTATGLYQFCNLTPGDYVVQVRPPLPVTGTAGPGYIPTTAATPVDPDSNAGDTDSNNTPAGTPTNPYQVVSTAVTLTVGGEPVGDEDSDSNTNNTVDFGFYPQVGVGNLVWKDKNGNSIYDSGDAPVPNVMVQVWPEGATPSGASPYQTTTDTNGHWLVTSMPPGRYFAFIPPSQFQSGGPLAGCRSTPGVEIQPASSAPDDDLGENGIDDLAPETNGIRTRNFNLRVDSEPFATFGETGEDLNADIGPSLDDDSIDLTKDFAFFAPAAITGTIYADTDNDNDGDVPINTVTLLLCRDLNGDGDAEDAGEGPADNPNTAEADVYTITTTNGTYGFTGLAPGGYLVKEAQPANFLNVTNFDSVPDLAGSPPDSSISPPLDTIPVVLVSGETDSGNDFIEEQTVAVGNLVFRDLDNDGKYEPASGELGLDGVAVELWRPGTNGAIGGGDDVLAGTMITSGGGCYLFSGLAPGTYFVQVPATEFATTALLANMLSSTGQDTAETADDNLNENGEDTAADGVTSGLLTLLLGTEPAGEPGKDGSTNALNLAADTNTNLTVDFGFYGLGSICGSNFADTDNNDTGDTLINVVTLTLFTDPNGDGVPDAAMDNPNTAGTQDYVITTADGTYCFTSLPPGGYVVVQTQPAGYTTVKDEDSTGDSTESPPDFPNSITSDNRIPVTLSGGETDSGNDFVEEQAKATDFATWQTQNPLGGQNGPTQNPDGDRYDNLAEYAFCIEPDSGSDTPFCLLKTGTSTADLTYTRAKGLADVTFTVQTAASLADPTVWSTFSGTPVIVDNGDGTESVTYANVLTAAAANGSSAFYRVCAATTTQTTCTEIQGWVRHDIIAGCETYACPLLPKAEVTGTVGTVTGQTLDVSSSLGSTDISGLLTPGTSYYIEITSGENTGQRFDITAASASTITLASDSDLCAAAAPYNTLAGSAPATLTGDAFAIYAHRTINGMFPVSQYQSGNSVSTADRILIKRGGAWDIYWLYTNGAGPAYWDLDGDAQFSDEGADVVPPSQGLFVHKVSTDTETTACVGEVRTWNYCAPLCEVDGCTLVAPGYPVDQSPADLGILLRDGWNGDADPTQADKFIIWKGDSGPDSGYVCYWLADAAPYQFWTVNGDAALPDADASKVFLRTRSAFLQPLAPRPDWCQPPPITP